MVFARERVCHLCGELVDFDAPPKSSRAPSVDHVIPLAQLKLLPRPTYLRMASDPSLCRLAHVGCNSRRCDRPVKRARSLPSRVW